MSQLLSLGCRKDQIWSFGNVVLFPPVAIRCAGNAVVMFPAVTPLCEHRSGNVQRFDHSEQKARAEVTWFRFCLSLTGTTRSAFYSDLRQFLFSGFRVCYSVWTMCCPFFASGTVLGFGVFIIVTAVLCVMFLSRSLCNACVCVCVCVCVHAFHDVYMCYVQS